MLEADRGVVKAQPSQARADTVAGRRKQAIKEGGNRQGLASFTFLSLRGIRAPGLNSLIWGSILAGSNTLFTPTSFIVHFWKT